MRQKTNKNDRNIKINKNISLYNLFRLLNKYLCIEIAVISYIIKLNKITKLKQYLQFKKA
jgi:hypothetical protein